MSQALCFNDITLSPVTHQNSLWIRAAELARALGYKDESSVRRIYDRNADEFTPDMSQVIEIPDTVNLTVTGNLISKARIFSLRGCHLIAMFARTPVAKQFRRWVLDVIERYAAEEQALAAGNARPSRFPKAVTTASTGADRRELHALVITQWCPKSGMRNYECWQKLNAHLGLKSIMDLPRERIEEAKNWVQAQIGGRLSPASPAPAPVTKSAPAIPCQSPALEPDVYLRGKRLFDKMDKLMTDFDLVKNHVMIWGRPGGRLARLSPEMESLYQNAVDASKMALCGLNQAHFALRIAMQIQAVHSFDKA